MAFNNLLFLLRAYFTFARLCGALIQPECQSVVTHIGDKPTRFICNYESPDFNDVELDITNNTNVILRTVENGVKSHLTHNASGKFLNLVFTKAFVEVQYLSLECKATLNSNVRQQTCHLVVCIEHEELMCEITPHNTTLSLYAVQCTYRSNCLTVLQCSINSNEVTPTSYRKIGQQYIMDYDHIHLQQNQVMECRLNHPLLQPGFQQHYSVRPPPQPTRTPANMTDTKATIETETTGSGAKGTQQQHESVRMMIPLMSLACLFSLDFL